LALLTELRDGGTVCKIEQAMTADDEREWVNTFSVTKQAKKRERAALGREKAKVFLREAAKTEDEIIYSGKPQQVANYYQDGTKDSANEVDPLSWR